MSQPSKICCNNLQLLSFAFCRTGTRCSLLWGYHQVQHGASVAEVVAAAEQAGVNLSNFEARLQEAKDKGLA